MFYFLEKYFQPINGLQFHAVKVNNQYIKNVLTQRRCIALQYRKSYIEEKIDL